MQHLPVPPLSDTLERYLKVVQPLLDADAYKTTKAVVAEFAEGDGPRLQRALEEFAEAENAAGRSWLADAWLEGYWQVRTPLPLTSSIAMQIDWPTQLIELDRASDIVHRLAAVHLAYLRGDLEPEVSLRGTPICPGQRRYLAGGLRRPRPEMDDYEFGPTDAADREIGVLWQGHLFAVRISDARGLPMSAGSLRPVLEAIRATPAVEGVSPVDISYLGSGTTAEHLDQLLADPQNAELYRRLTGMVFLVNLSDVEASNVEHLERINFAAGQAWAYKTVTYQINLADPFVAMHVEHSLPDGGTLERTVAYALEHEWAGGADETGEPEALEWRYPDGMAARLADDVAAYRARAAKYRARIVHVPLPRRPDLPFRISPDACQQFVMLYAQLKTYGRVRNTYEAVDMREYQAGRTEAMRPNTAEAVALAQGMVDGTATPEQLKAALETHRERVKAAKSGNAVDRHLLGLLRMAQQIGVEPRLFTDTGYQLLGTNFLSTTSLGRRTPIVRVSFAPVTPDGIGLYYTASENDYEFLVMWREDECVDIERFVSALQEGSDALEQVIADAAP